MHKQERWVVTRLAVALRTKSAVSERARPEAAYLEQAVPATGAEGHTVPADAQAADAVLVSSKNTDTLTLERVPHVTVVIIVASEQHATRDREGDGRDAAQDVVVVVRVELAVGTEVEQAA